MNPKPLALIGYPAEYFHPFGMALELAGFEVHWVCALHADALHLRSRGVADKRILDLTEGFHPGTTALEECRAALATFENDRDPRFNDIILMDRLLRLKDWRFSLAFLHHTASRLSDFLCHRRIGLVSSWRDTAVQMTALLVSRHHGIPFVVPTRIRIPQEIYGFCDAHHTDSFVELAEPSDDDREWAEQFLDAFELREVKPALKKASRSFADVLRLLPSHWRAFRYELRRAGADRGNDYTRYPIGRLVQMYLRRRWNLLRYQQVRPGHLEADGQTRFCVYALHTQPESSIDVQGSYFSDQVELIRHIARSLPASHVLYVKVHPTDVDGKSLSFYRSIASIPSVVLLDFTVDSRWLLDHADIVFALTGTIAYEAGLMRRPAIVFARNYFNRLPTVHLCKAPTDLPVLIARVLSTRPDADALRPEVVEFMARLRASCFEGEVSRTYGASNEQLRPFDLATVCRAYEAVYARMEKGDAT